MGYHGKPWNKPTQHTHLICDDVSKTLEKETAYSISDVSKTRMPTVEEQKQIHSLLLHRQQC